ncbi:uncharacterized protein LOC134210359 [Armigeres subalbatus]|uniref:uncharacterized protein LOC134210359 n=1 Tax=Armigeres subalbatus TaxID=124917 RepID=UPI002ED1FAD0
MLMQILQQQQQLMAQLTLTLGTHDSDDFVSYSCKVNKACVVFKLRELSEEQFKCLIFVCDLKSWRDSDIRIRLIIKLNETEDISLEKVVEDCKSLLNLKQDNSLVKKQQSFSAVNAVHQDRPSKPKHKQGAGGKVNNNQPKTQSTGGYCACFSSENTSGNKNKKKMYSSKHSKDVNIVSVKNISQRWKYVEIYINDVPVRLQFDSASDITIISGKLWRKIGQPQGIPSPCNAKSASGESLDLAREFLCNVNISDKTKKCLNDVLESNQCPLPLPEDIFTKMAECKCFSHIDISDAYLQVEVDP